MPALFLALTLTAAAPAVPPDTTAFRLDAHQWRHRVLVVFAPSPEAAPLATQAARIEAARAGFVERDLIVATVVAEGPSRAQTTPGAEAAPMPAADAARLRTRLAVPPDAFRVVLVGKDGTAKRRDDAPVAPAALFATIDAMPMRQREMREGDGGG